MYMVVLDILRMVAKSPPILCGISTQTKEWDVYHLPTGDSDFAGPWLVALRYNLDLGGMIPGSLYRMGPPVELAFSW